MQKTAYELRISDWSSDVCSSDLAARAFRFVDGCARFVLLPWVHATRSGAGSFSPRSTRSRQGTELRNQERRSEEHTSELQSLMRISYAVFCLKKKKKTKTSIDNHIYTNR